MARMDQLEHVAKAGALGGKQKAANFYEKNADNILQALWLYQYTPLTQSQIAAACGISQPFVSRLAADPLVKVTRLQTQITGRQYDQIDFQDWKKQPQQQQKLERMRKNLMGVISGTVLIGS